MNRLPHPSLTFPGAIPAVVIRALPVAIAAIGFVLVPWPYALVALVAAAVGAAVPATLGVWIAIGVLCLAGLWHPADIGQWRAYVTLAIAHLMHVVGAVSMVLPLRARVRVRVLARPLRRWLMLQVPAQVLMALALWTAAMVADAHVAAAAVWAAVAVLGALVALVVQLRRG